jgi:HAD superfamily hydrolase (TIGR01509 family)
MRPTYDLVIFDCDGVLVDSEPISARVGAAVLTDLGWPVTAEEVAKRFVGCTDDHWRREVESQLGRALPDDWESPYETWYDQAFDAELKAVAGVSNALDAVEEEGVPYCVASNGSHPKIAANLARTGLAERFQGRVFSAQDVSAGKPRPDLFLHAARQMGVAPPRCVVVEDSPVGLAAARAAGMDCLAFAGGLLEEERLRGPRTRLFGDMAQLGGLLSGTVL